LNSELLKAENIRAEISARYEQARVLLKDPDGVHGAADVLKSRLVGDLRIRETEFQRRIAEMSTRYRDEHPKVIQLRDQLIDLKRAMAEEIQKILVNLKNETTIADKRVENLAELTRRMEERFADERKAEVSLRALETEVNANKQLYEVLLERFKETDVQDATLQSAEARVISRAVVPDVPVFPRKRIMVFAALLVSLVSGVLLAVGLEYFITGYRTIRELEIDTGMPVLSMIPTELHLRQKHTAMPRYVMERPHARVSEAVRKLRSALTLAARPTNGKVIVVSSAVRGEGKTSIAASLAMLTAKAGIRVLLIDGNLRSSEIHTAIGHRNLGGLSDVLADEAHQDDLIEFDFSTGMYYLTAGTPRDNQEDLLDSPQMDELMRWSRRHFDYVIIDTPPVLSVADAQVIMSRADEAILCARWEATPRESVKRAVRMVFESGAGLAGIVLTQVDLNIQRMVYGADYTAYYYYGSKDAA
jgi:capsular exopolysaccharide synthesis family protein